jgi:hypothetical protein
MIMRTAPAFWTPRIIRHALFGIVLLGAGACWERDWRSRDQAQNERHASTALKMLSSAEADFRGNDRDVNGVNDFWTADVAGLYYVQAWGRPIALIPKEIADADASPLRATTKDPVPFHGYYFAALWSDESVTPPALYRQETDGKTGKVHNLTQFGFVAYPAEPDVSGKYIFVLNENNSLRMAHASEGPPPESWPNFRDAKRTWGTVCRIPAGEAEGLPAFARMPKKVPGVR